MASTLPNLAQDASRQPDIPEYGPKVAQDGSNMVQMVQYGSKMGKQALENMLLRLWKN
jgi:hypothetical protein